MVICIRQLYERLLGWGCSFIIPSLSACKLSCVWLFAIPWTAARQSPLSRKFSRQEYWSGFPFPTQSHLPYPAFVLNHLGNPLGNKDVKFVLARFPFLVVESVLALCLQSGSDVEWRGSDGMWGPPPHHLIKACHLWSIFTSWCHPHFPSLRVSQLLWRRKFLQKHVT